MEPDSRNSIEDCERMVRYSIRGGLISAWVQKASAGLQGAELKSCIKGALLAEDNPALGQWRQRLHTSFRTPHEHSLMRECIERLLRARAQQGGGDRSGRTGLQQTFGSLLLKQQKPGAGGAGLLHTRDATELREGYYGEIKNPLRFARSPGLSSQSHASSARSRCPRGAPESMT